MPRDVPKKTQLVRSMGFKSLPLAVKRATLSDCVDGTAAGAWATTRSVTAAAMTANAAIAETRTFGELSLFIVPPFTGREARYREWKPAFGPCDEGHDRRDETGRGPTESYAVTPGS